MSEDIVITGSGALAAAIVRSLIPPANANLRVTVMSRRSTRLYWLGRSAVARARSLDINIRFNIRCIDWDNQIGLCRTLTQLRPRIVVHTASLQSPWTLGGQDAWTALVRRAGYGVTLPLQFVLAHRLGRALAMTGQDTYFLNACYPDAVNPMLAAVGLPVLCGVGNVAILAALLAAKSEQSGTIRMVAHHAHVTAGILGDQAALPYLKAWRDAASIDDEARMWLTRAALPADQRLNEVTSATGARTLMSLLDLCEPGVTSVPGPLGLPGGYPVKIENRRLRLDLPQGISEQDAVQLNVAAAVHDGVVVTKDGVARFSSSAVDALQNALPREAMRAPFRVTDVEALAGKLIALRATLENRSPFSHLSLPGRDT